MSTLRSFKQSLSAISRLWEEKDYDTALTKVEELRRTWPGNSHLHILWAGLVQLQENPRHSLEEARQALQQAIDLDKSSPAGVIELGHFLDAVEDNPQAAAKTYAEGVARARQLWLDGLIGQAKALLQLDKREEALGCVQEILHLLPFEPRPKRDRSEEPDIIIRSSSGPTFDVQAKGPFAKQIEKLLSDLFACRSA
ncbi:MAG: hypothetical protein L0Y71_19085 [Gemmataceae bacterium]|nr:hypothetical protein [Gemmataceae bacterium]